MTDILVDLYDVDGIDFDSESIEAIAYDRQDKVLYVQFQDGSTVYGYEGVEESTYNLLKDADSLNRFWREHISSKYTSTKHEDADLFYREAEQVSTVDVTKAEVVASDAAGLSRYSVDWYDDNSSITGKPEYQATGEEDALRQFYAQLGDAKGFLGADIQPVIKGVTHYFD